LPCYPTTLYSDKPAPYPTWNLTKSVSLLIKFYVNKSLLQC
jgi:hypothetical protein